MPNLTQLRLAAREIFKEALREVDAATAVRRAVTRAGLRLKILETVVDLSPPRPVYTIAMGKAAFAMASALEGILGERLAGGVLSGPERAPEVKRLGYEVFRGGHPEPSEQSLAAAEACFDLLRRADQERALIIFLISGGGSAMIEWPINEDITLADLRAAHRTLVNCGASITEINGVRRAFSAVKGGRLADLAPHCDQITLIVSDVPQGEESSVASGPTLVPPEGATHAREVIARYDLRSRLPETILRAIDAATEPSTLHDSTSLRANFVLLDNRRAIEAAAEAGRRRGFITHIADDISDQSIEEACPALLERLRQLRGSHGDVDLVCLISGGEFTCRVRGDGTGGRNSETALRLAQSTGSDLSTSVNFVAVCAGTDGIDGNSPAAGAIVDSTTLQRARAIGLDLQDFLDRSDAYSFFVALGDVVATGPTGTNVRDIRILLASA